MTPLTRRRSGRTLAAVLLMAASVACTRAAPPILPADEPYVRGVVESVRTSTPGAEIQVRSAGGCGLNGNTHAETRYLRRLSGGRLEPARLADVQARQEVSVWVTGPMTRSCPPMGQISAIVIEPA
jgi:hypothetical protein